MFAKFEDGTRYMPRIKIILCDEEGKEYGFGLETDIEGFCKKKGFIERIAEHLDKLLIDTPHKHT